MKKQIILDGIPLNYSLLGAGQPILMLHGIGFGLYQFIHQSLDLSTNFQIILFEVPSTPFNYSLDWLTCLLANFLDYLGISKVIILGSSFGGFLAQQFTLNFPERVKHLFIINTAASGSRVPFKIRSMRFLVPFLPSKFFEWLYFLIQSGPTKTLLMTHPQAKSSLPTKKMFLQRLKSIKTFNALPRLPMLSVPTTIFYGIKDNILSPATSKELHQLISNSVLVTLDSGHVPCLEIPIIFNRKLREFLSL